MLTEEERTAAGELLASFGSVAMKRMIDEGATTTFGNEIGQLAMENVFARLWLRPGLDRRSRSLLTLGILIALQAHAELKVHVLIALKNGLSVEELEEVIYHATGYAGFPAAYGARVAAVEALRMEGIIE
jgi:4-carboxymuconolactone decarboxylase